MHCIETNLTLHLKRGLSNLKDLSHGLAYLHHHSSSVIVHYDLKPSNILLDEMMMTHVGDFSISWMLISTVGHQRKTQETYPRAFPLDLLVTLHYVNNDIHAWLVNPYCSWIYINPHTTTTFWINYNASMTNMLKTTKSIT